jgi:hypothetical protein
VNARGQVVGAMLSPRVRDGITTCSHRSAERITRADGRCFGRARAFTAVWCSMANAVETILATLEDRPSGWQVVDALVPAWADLGIMWLRDGHELHVTAYTHIDPAQMSTLRDFQSVYRPSLDDPVSIAARVFRSGLPECLAPLTPTAIDTDIATPALRAFVRAIGPRTTLFAPLVAGPTKLGVLLTAMSSSGRQVDERDLELLAAFAREVSPRLAHLANGE